MLIFIACFLNYFYSRFWKTNKFVIIYLYIVLVYKMKVYIIACVLLVLIISGKYTHGSNGEIIINLNG